MRKKYFSVVLIWIGMATVVLILYLLREVSPVKEFIAWALSVWPLLAAIGTVALIFSGWVMKHDFSKPAEKMSDIVEAKHDCANIEVKPRVFNIREIFWKSNLHILSYFTTTENDY